MKNVKFLLIGFVAIIVLAFIHAPITEAAIDAVSKLKAQLSTVLADNGTGGYSLNTGEVALASLDLGIKPSHVAKYAGFATWSSVGKTKKVAIVGAVATDILVVTPKTAQTSERLIIAYVLKNNTAIFKLYTGEINTKSMQYVVHRAAQ